MTRPRISLARGGRGSERALRELTELCRAGLDSVTFRRELRARLAQLLPFDGYCVNSVDPESLLITSSIGDGLSASAAHRLFELEAAGTDVNPLGSLARGPVHVATIWQSTLGKVVLSQRMREVFLPLGWGDELRAALVVDGHCWGYLQLFRAVGTPFSAQDVSLIERVSAMLGAALRAACVVGQHAVAQRAQAVLLLGSQGELVAESETTRSWLQGFESDVGRPLPHPIYAVGARARVGASASARYRGPGGGWLAFTGTALGADVAVLLGSVAGRELSRLLFLAHGLTAREREVASLLLDGYGNDAVAANLGISLHTAKDHVKAIFQKTAVGGRAELSARFAV